MAAKSAGAYGVFEEVGAGGGFGSGGGAVRVADFGLGLRGWPRPRSGLTPARGENPLLVWVFGVFRLWFP